MIILCLTYSVYSLVLMSLMGHIVFYVISIGTLAIINLPSKSAGYSTACGEL